MVAGRVMHNPEEAADGLALAQGPTIGFSGRRRRVLCRVGPFSRVPMCPGRLVKNANAVTRRHGSVGEVRRGFEQSKVHICVDPQCAFRVLNFEESLRQ